MAGKGVGAKPGPRGRKTDWRAVVGSLSYGELTECAKLATGLAESKRAVEIAELEQRLKELKAT